MTKEELQAAVKTAQSNLADAEHALLAFERVPANNVFETLAFALTAIEAKLERQAFQDCEGAHNCGMPTYEQGFIVDGIEYLGTLHVEYNRHDKMYYYIDGSTFTHKVVGAAPNGPERP